jgi:selenide, water dikinase
VRVAGGHTATGAEPMAGLMAIGAPRSDRVLGKTGARPGDRLLLSKPLGVGLVTRAYRLGVADEAAFETALALMETSNGPASAFAVAAGIQTATDVSGFGFLGHLAELLTDDLGAEIDLRDVPVLDAARPLLSGSHRTDWTDGNFDYAGSRRRLTGVTDTARLLPLLDPQTNGGLLVAAAPDAAARLQEGGFVPVGRVTGSGTIAITVGS